MSTIAGSQPMTLRHSWRSTLETWVVQAVDVVDHVVAVEVEVEVEVEVVVAAAKPPGQCVVEGLTRYGALSTA